MKNRPNYSFVCSNCGHTSAKWLGQCPSCASWSTMEEQVLTQIEKQLLKNSSGPSEVLSMKDISHLQTYRISTSFYEFDRVLGGGFVDGEVVLIAGEPGIGKSTLLLQIYFNIAKKYNVLYVSGEESAGQVVMRANRLFGVASIEEKHKFLSSGDLSSIILAIQENKPKFLVIDSIQTLYDNSVNSLPGSVSQIRHCVGQLINIAKKEDIVLLLVGHITKEGDIGGPKLLEHIVDAVFQFEGKRDGSYRVLRGLKNRFGSTGEVGIFSMGEKGMSDVSLAHSDFVDLESFSDKGLAKGVVVEGNRPLLIDIQSLISKTAYAYPKRVAEGISLSRIQLSAALVENMKIASLVDKDIYVRIAGGYNVKGNPSLDLAIIASLVSGVREHSSSGLIIYMGEVSLTGKISISKSFLDPLVELARLVPKAKFVIGKGISLPKKLEPRVLVINNLRDLVGKSK